MPECTDKEVELIIKSLPDNVHPQRLKLLPQILLDWTSVELPLYLASQSTKDRKRLIENLTAVGTYASKLTQALNTLDDTDDLFWIVRGIAEAEKMILRQAERKTLECQQQEMRSFLSRLPSASAASVKRLKRGRGQPRNVVASLALRDIVAIYEWLTGTKATRQTDRVSGEETGPFWKFASAIWPVIFNRGDEGLPAAVKNWASARKQLTGFPSPLLVNLAQRHPEWGLFNT